MKCPRCHTEVAGESKCSKCGLDVLGSREEIEVEYKDFKTSELLEIRHKKQVAREHEEIKSVGERKGEKALERDFCEDKKKPFSFLAAMALILMLIAGVFLIFRYFIVR